MKAPGSSAKADNQGSSQTCSGHALAKAATQAADDLGHDVDQSAITSVIVNRFEDNDAKFPTDFQNTSLKIMDKKTKEWLVMTIILSICTLDDFKNDPTNQHGHYLVDYDTDKGPHCIFAKKWDKNKKKVVGVNSWGKKQPKPEIKPAKVRVMYRVQIMLQDLDGDEVCKTHGFKEVVQEKVSFFSKCISQSHKFISQKSKNVLSYLSRN